MYLSPLIVVGIVLLSPLAKAEQKADSLFSLSFEQLQGLTVSAASNVIASVRKQPVSLTTITRDKIQLSGARTLNELLTLFVPGYFLVEDQDDTIAGVRGLVADNNSKLMVLLNGSQLNTEWFWGAPDAILNGMDMGFIERIEVIRGPGSVTQGQGALLGVINIITRSVEAGGAGVSYRHGRDGLQQVTIDGSYFSDNSKGYAYFSSGSYDGQTLRDEGWASNRLEQGLSVYQRQHGLKRSEYTTFFASLEYRDFKLDLHHFEQERDLYNFYRDREVVGQTLDGMAGQYRYQVNEQLGLTLSAHYTEDEYELRSHGGNIPTQERFVYESEGSGFASIIDLVPGLADDRVESGLTMGGTREVRKGLKLLVNWDQLWPGNKLAFGFEYTDYEYGQRNSRGDNFIINEEIQRFGLASDGMGGFTASGSVNDNNAWVKPGAVDVQSAFIEDFYSLSPNFDVFAALRYDRHPNWGSQVSPRIGGLYDIGGRHLFRVTWQTGFRGAVGVQFSGGFVQDGLLAQENFGVVNALATSHVDFDFDGIAANDTGNLQPVDPETIESLEFAYTYTNDRLEIGGVVFFNTVEDILTAQAHGYEGLGFGDKIGSDDIGTWGGNWYYQNQNGTLEQIGVELELRYKWQRWDLGASHAHVEVVSADPGTIGIYVLPGKKTAAFPEDVSRVHLAYGISTAVGTWTAQYNHLYYWGYDAPTGVNVDGNHIANLGLRWSPAGNWQNMYLDMVVKNLWDEDELYPINGTGDLAGADGAPALEARSWWLEIGFSF